MASSATDYAGQLFGQSRDPKATREALVTLATVLASVPLAGQVLVDSVTRTPREQAKVVEAVLADFDEVLRQLVIQLLRDDALDTLPNVASRYQALLKSRTGTVMVTVETVRPLTDRQVQEALHRLGLDPSKAVVTQVVKPELVGGLRVIVDDLEHDLSVGGALTRLADQLASG